MMTRRIEQPAHPMRSTTALDNVVTVIPPTRLQRARRFAGRYWPVLIFAWLLYEIAAPFALAFWWIQ